MNITNARDDKLSFITALVCTCNRGDSVVATVQSILANEHDKFEIIIIDQSDDDRSECAVKGICDEKGRIRYFRSSEKGLGKAHNLGLSLARAEVIAITDDDCVTPVNWLSVVSSIFYEYPRVAMAFYNVIAAPHDIRLGFVPEYVRTGNAHVKNFRDKLSARGIGAGMAVRRSDAISIGGFDECLGPGAIFRSCEEIDLAIRALDQGFEIFETDSVAVTHFGFRTLAEGRDLVRRDWYGIGAAYAKPLKSGRAGFWIIVLSELFRYAVVPIFTELFQLRSPRGLARIVYFLRGFIRGISTPVDKNNLLFISK